jgi:hypothetical protein
VRAWIHRGLVFLSAGLVFCDRPSSPTAPSASAVSGSSRAAPSAAPAEQPLPAAPSDLDVDSLKKKLGCAANVARQACRVLAEFGAAARFEPRIPSGEGRWIGNASALEPPSKSSELMLLSASQVPTASVPAGELPLRVGTGSMPEDKRIHGVKLANALARGDTVPKTNAAAPYVKNWKSAEAQGTMNTSGVSVRLVAQETFLRQASGGKVLLVHLKPSKTGALEGTVAELWAASW